VLRDRIIRKLEEKYGKIGSGYPSDPVTVNFLKKSIEKGVDLSGIARTHWKTYKNLYRKGRTGKLF
jgi:ribonuclease HII